MKWISILALSLCFSLNSIHAQQSLLSDGNWHKFTTVQDAVHQLSFEVLENVGALSGPVPSAALKVYSHGPGMLPEENAEPRIYDLQEIAIHVEDQGDGEFGPGDFFLFYGTDQTNWNYSQEENRFAHTTHLYDDATHFLFTTGTGNGLRIAQDTATSLPVTIQADFYQRLSHHEIEQHNFHSSGKLWFGESFEDDNSLDFSFYFPGILTGTTAHCIVDLVSRSYGVGNNNSFSVTAAETTSDFEVVNISNNYLNDIVRAGQHSMDFTATGTIVDINVTMEPIDQYSAAWMNFIEVWADCALIKVAGQQLQFRNVAGLGQSGATEYTISNAEELDFVWDVTDFHAPIAMSGTHVSDSYVFEADHEDLREFICFRPSDCPLPMYIGAVPNQDLKGQPFAEGFIVTHPNFLAQAQQLALFHALNDGISVNVATTEQIYNEFSGGTKDITAIKDYLRYFYENADQENPLPRYLCILGDASFDPRGHLYPNSDFVPTFQSEASFALITSYCSDDYYGLLETGDGNSLQSTVKLGIGRLPATTVSEAQTIVDKIIAYHNPDYDGQWQRDFLFVADDEDSNLHMGQSNTLADSISNKNCAVNTRKIFLDNYPQVNTGNGNRYPAAREAILAQLSSGALICNYTGHSGYSNWSSELVMVDTNFAQLDNAPRYPLFFMANCEFSKFDSPAHLSGSEIMLFNPNGGAISCVSNSRPGYSSANFLFNTNFYKNLFLEQNGNYPRLGDLLRFAKNSSISSSGMSHRSNNLLGDPMMRLNIPDFDIVVQQVSGAPAFQGNYLFPYNGTISIEGAVTHTSGNIATEFNGELSYLILDSHVPVVTLANDQNMIPFEFTARLDTVAQGSTLVENGIFSIDVFISGNGNGYGGNGKLLLYASDDVKSAAGCYSDFSVAESPVGVAEKDLFSATVFPNPAESTLRVEMKTDYQEVQIELYTSAGKQVLTESFQQTQYMEISLQGFSDGVYFLKISGAQLHPTTIKVIKQQ